MYDDILVPTDGGENVDRIVDHALDVAERRNARIHALYVVDTRSFITLDADTVDDVVDELTTEGVRATGEVTDRARGAELETASDVRRGNPAEVVLDYLFETDIDLVVMGHHDESDQRAMFGSVAQQLVSEATTPVLTVPIGE